MANTKLIAVYGNGTDRLKAAVLAKKIGSPSISKMLLTYIRSEYAKHFGEANPAHVAELTDGQ